MNLSRNDITRIREQLAAGWVSPKKLASEWNIPTALAAHFIKCHEANDWPKQAPQ